MLKKYLAVFFISMVPILELRGAVPIAQGMGIDEIPALIICVIGNMVPVPLVYFFARKILCWGAEKRYIGKLCSFFLNKGERAGQKLAKTAGRGGLFVALMLFVGIPLPGTGAWTGALVAAMIDMPLKKACEKYGVTIDQMHAPFPSMKVGNHEMNAYIHMAFEKCIRLFF